MTIGADFTTETKLRALQRDGYICQCCGVRLMRDGRLGTGKSYHIHHRKPKSLGGSNSLANASSVCTGCHDLLHKVQSRGFTFPEACNIVQIAKSNKLSIDETIRRLSR